ncbi:MAG: aminoglycoside 6-adenylyltransferase [Wujia sp.]
MKHKVDVWHDGRFLDKWAEERILIELKKCFAHYDRDDIIQALFATGELFAGLARETADMKGYIYPIEAEQYAFSLLRSYFEI